jgi:hypothetical protein
MAANLSVHIPAGSVQTVSGNTPFTASISELAGQNFFQGAAVQLTTTGFIQQWDGTTVVAGIAGFSLMPGSNLATDGAGTPGQFSQVGPPGTSTTYGAVPFQPFAVNIPLGAPPADGRTLFEAANSDTIFQAQWDNSAGVTAADWTPTIANIGHQFGLTFDPSGFIYVDGGKITPGTNTAVTIVGINPVDLVQDGTPNTYILNARVFFTVLPTTKQIF